MSVNACKLNLTFPLFLLSYLTYMIKDRLKRRHLRIRKRIFGTPERLRVCVRRSNKHIYAMLVDDTKNRVLTAVSTLSKELRENKKPGKTSMAKEVGILLAKKAMALGCKKIVFDRGGYKYHGRVKAVAEGLREIGIEC